MGLILTPQEAHDLRMEEHREWETLRYRTFRAWLDAYKLERGCMDCGYADHPSALEFDHREPSTKNFVISQSYNRLPALIMAEIALCDIVCANCHRVRSVLGVRAGTIKAGRPRNVVI